MDQNLPPGQNSPQNTPPLPPESSPPGDVTPSEIPPADTTPPPINRPPGAPPPFNAPPPPPPPPLNPPPPIIMAAPAPGPRKGGRVWKVLAILLFLALGISLLFNFGQFATKVSVPGSTVQQKRRHFQEILLEDNESKNKILVIDVDGIISSTDHEGRGQSIVEKIQTQLEIAAEPARRISAVILKVNSPGGEVLASDEIYHAIRDFQKDTGKPVVSSMQTLAASGGYYVSAPCRWIVANELTITGSIGVIMQGWNYRGLMDKVGIRPDTYKSGKFKDMLSGARKETDIPPEEKVMIQGLITEVYDKFTNIVQTGRSEAYRQNSKSKGKEDKGRPLHEDWTDYVDGRVLSGKQAHDLGFVDELGDFRTAVERAQTLAGITTANLIQYEQPLDFGDLFRLFGKSEDPSVKVDIGMDFPKLRPGCLYFLYQQAVP